MPRTLRIVTIAYSTGIPRVRCCTHRDGTVSGELEGERILSAAVRASLGPSRTFVSIFLFSNLDIPRTRVLVRVDRAKVITRRLLVLLLLY